MADGPVRWNVLAALLAAGFLAAVGGLYWGARGGGVAAWWLGAAGLAAVFLLAQFAAMVRRAAEPRPRFDELGSSWWGAVFLEGVGASAAALGLVQVAASPWGLDPAGGAATTAAGLAGLLAGSLVLDRGVAPWLPSAAGLLGVPVVVYAMSAWPVAGGYLGLLAFWGLVRTVADPAMPGNRRLEEDEAGEGDPSGSGGP